MSLIDVVSAFLLVFGFLLIICSFFAEDVRYIILAFIIEFLAFVLNGNIVLW